MESNVPERVIAKLRFESRGERFALVSGTIHCCWTLLEHLSPDELEMLLLNRASADAVEKAEEHLLVCEQCQDAARAIEIELAALRRAIE